MIAPTNVATHPQIILTSKFLQYIMQNAPHSCRYVQHPSCAPDVSETARCVLHRKNVVQTVNNADVPSSLSLYVSCTGCYVPGRRCTHVVCTLAAVNVAYLPRIGSRLLQSAAAVLYRLLCCLASSPSFLDSIRSACQNQLIQPTFASPLPFHVADMAFLNRLRCFGCSAAAARASKINTIKLPNADSASHFVFYDGRDTVAAFYGRRIEGARAGGRENVYQGRCRR